MTYLKLTRAKAILASFAIVSLLFVNFPSVDIQVSKWFFESGFYSQKEWWEQMLHHGVKYFVGISVGVILGLYAFNKFAKRSVGGVDGKKVVYALTVLILGAGLLVNAGFKDHFGRARPRDVHEFGGAKLFTPAYVVSNQCTTNCSFVSGDTAAAFFSLTLAMAFRRRRALLLASLAFGIGVSIARLAAGAHFLSDVTVAFFVMLITSDVLYHYMLSPEREALRMKKAVPAIAVAPAAD
ncbi:MAG TPA: phosphatase PAP2 family protein [Steroidobacteraceae bacterium]|nr:phosphatase PAP2 family protein [Steroidobacteraceae bacterium]